MKLYLLRHGIAEEISATGRDADRRLTDDGIAEMERAAVGLKRLGLAVDAVLTSPFSRARETAEIVARVLSIEERLRIDNRLAPGFGMGRFQEIVAENSGVQRLLLVGHNFDFPVLAGRLAGGAAIELKKGGLLRLDVSAPETGGGVLEWVLTPKQMILAGES